MGKRYDLTGDSADELRDNLYAIVDKEAGIAGVTFKLSGGDPSVLKAWKRRMRAGGREVSSQNGRAVALNVVSRLPSTSVTNAVTPSAKPAMELLAYRPVSAADARAKLEVWDP